MWHWLLSVHTEPIKYALLLHHVNKPCSHQLCAGDQFGDVTTKYKMDEFSKIASRPTYVLFTQKTQFTL